MSDGFYQDPTVDEVEEDRARMSGDTCTVNLLGGTCPVANLCPVHGCTEELCRCEDEPGSGDRA